jgi:hypothetical protein
VPLVHVPGMLFDMKIRARFVRRWRRRGEGRKMERKKEV